MPFRPQAQTQEAPIGYIALGEEELERSPHGVRQSQRTTGRCWRCLPWMTSSSHLASLAPTLPRISPSFDLERSRLTARPCLARLVINSRPPRLLREQFRGLGLVSRAANLVPPDPLWLFGLGSGASKMWWRIIGIASVGTARNRSVRYKRPRLALRVMREHSV